MSKSDAQYYAKRAAAELALAQGASLPSVVAAHYRLSCLYLERAQALAPSAGVSEAVAA